MCTTGLLSRVSDFGECPLSQGSTVFKVQPRYRCETHKQSLGMEEERAAYFAASLSLPGAGLGLLGRNPSLERVVAQAGLAQRRLKLRIPWR